MATFNQNIDNIRGAALKGSVMRESIAEAIEQAQGLEGIPGFRARWAQAKQEMMDSSVIVDLEVLEEDNYRMILSGKD